MSATQPLDFNSVDDLGFAAAFGQLGPDPLPVSFKTDALGPLVELLFLVDSGLVPTAAIHRYVDLNGAASFVNAYTERRELWLAPGNYRMGIVRAGRTGPNAVQKLTEFLMRAKRAAQDVAGIPKGPAGQLVAAMKELENNIHEHSEAPDTGVVAYRVAPQSFEFIAADLGVGILRSLQSCPEYETLSDHANALEIALRDGASRHGSKSNRGYGFRPIFIGLLNLNGHLRFRSGDCALTIDGVGPDLKSSQVAQKPQLSGFCASVKCDLTLEGRINVMRRS